MFNNILNDKSQKSSILNTDTTKQCSDTIENHRESPNFISQLKEVNNSSKQLIHSSDRNTSFIARLTHIWRSFLALGTSQTHEIYDEEMQDILSEGKYYLSQIDSLNTEVNDKPSYYAWRCNAFKRCLIAVGMLTGTGVIAGVGYKYYARRSYDHENTGQLTLFPSPSPSQSNFIGCHDLQLNVDDVVLPADLFSVRNCEYNLEVDIINNMVTQPLDFLFSFDENKRNKRSIVIKNEYIPNLIMGIVVDPNIDWRVRNEFDIVFRRADDSPDVKSSKSSAEKHIKLLFKTIQIVQQCIDSNKYGHAGYKAFEAFPNILEKLWDIANKLEDAYSKLYVERFKKVYGFNKENSPEPDNPTEKKAFSSVEKLGVASNTVVPAAAVAGGAAIIIGVGGCASCVNGASGVGSAGSIAGSAGLAASGTGLAASGAGLAASGTGLAASGAGLAAGGAGLAAGGTGLAVGGTGLAAGGAGLAASEIESVGSSINLAVNIAGKISRKINDVSFDDTRPYPFDPEKNEIPQMGFDTETQDVIEVEIGGMETVTNDSTVLSTSGLSDCSALAVLSDWRGSFYGSRTLIHINGSNVSSGLKYGVDASGLIAELQRQLARGGKVIWVGGNQSQSTVGLGISIGQTNSLGRQPLYELLNTSDVSIDIAGSTEVTVYPDGSFSLGHTGRGVLTPQEINDVLSFAEDI